MGRIGTGVDERFLGFNVLWDWLDLFWELRAMIFNATSAASALGVAISLTSDLRTLYK